MQFDEMIFYALLGVPIFYGVSRSVQMSWPAALCALLIAAGVVLAHPTGTLFERTLSGRFARRMVPTVVALVRSTVIWIRQRPSEATT